MGTYLNPGNEGFERILKNYYIDKTGMIALINERIDTPESLICVSRPRRFGKSYAAQMLCAYYDHTCDSHNQFNGKNISSNSNYEDYLNQYQVIYLDMSNLLGKVKPEALISFIEENVTAELLSFDSNIKKGTTFDQTLINAVETVGKKFIMIIDEWDAPIRETPQISKEYLLFLRMLFKSSNTTAKIFAAAYMTGILPIKKDGLQSAVSDFREYSVLNPLFFAKYTGFTEEEVRNICDHYHMDFDEAKKWYDGYSFAQAESIYNPYSVMMAMNMGEFESYWKQTSVAENLVTYINMNQGDLQSDILKLIAGERLKINVSRFNNDFQTFKSEDDVLTLLVHLGYLAYDKKDKRVRIPNEEVRFEFNELLSNAQHTRLANLITASEKLLKDTLAGNEAAVAETIERVRETNYAPQYYNNEQSLRYVIKFAYIVCVDNYLKIEELPTGKGVADVVFIPNRDTALPAMIVELKWEKSADAALDQIRNKKYPSILSEYCGEIVLVGINYDEKSKEHTCKIEKLMK